MDPEDAVRRVIDLSPWVTLAVVALYGLGGGALAFIQDRGMRAFVVNLPRPTRMQSHSVDVSFPAKRLMLLSAGSGALRIAVFVAFAAFATVVPTSGSMGDRSAWYIVPPVIVLGVMTGISQHLRYREPPWVGSPLRVRILATFTVVVGSVAGAAAVGVGLLMISTAVVLVLIPVELLRVMDLSTVSPAGVMLFVVPAFITGALGVLLLQWSPRPSRFARSVLQIPLRELVRNSASVTLLRSFEDDAVATRTPPGHASLAESFASDSFVNFEEVLTWELLRTGPVIALGQPGQENRLMLGAVRDYFDDANWQSGVAGLLAQSCMIVVIAGRAPGLGWEYAQLRAQGLLAKTIFVLPPLSDDKLQDRRLILEASLNLSSEVLDCGPNRTPICLHFDGEGSPIVMCAAGREGRAYVAALRAAAALVRQQYQAVVHAPAGQYFAPANDIKALYRSFDPKQVPRAPISKLTRLAARIVWP